MSRPTWFKADKVVKETGFVWGEIEYPLFVLTRTAIRILPNFVGFPEPHEFFIISEEVPEPYWLPVIGHEAMEILEFGERPNRCYLATIRELELVDQSIRGEYLAWRIRFFEEFIRYARLVPKSRYMRQLAKRTTQALAYLRSVES